ncbi:MAG: transporter substrate-binding domain-containing protein [Alphaproteobacteria bacterium]|nr:transporter substrate-binding domain-containing protein [Alphaproteobacteria bacterium]
MLAVVASGLLGMSAAQAQPERLSVVYCEDLYPFHYRDEAGEAAGLLIDTWRLWSEKTGIALDFTAAPWDESIRMVGDGEVDAHAGLFFSEERDRFLDYGTAMRKTDTHVFFHRSIPATTRLLPMIRKTALLAATCLTLAAAAVQAQETRYEPWGESVQGNSTQDMVNQLRDLIRAAEQARAADPRFLTDLKALADRYEGIAQAPVPAPVPVARTVLQDDFRDGNFDRGTAWRITRGRWWIESHVGLRSHVADQRYAPQVTTQQDPAPAPDRPRDDLAEAIIGNILDEMLRPENGGAQPQPQPEPQPQPQQAGDSLPAEIQAEANIPNAFSMRLELSSRERYGEFRAGVYQVSTQNGWGYALAYTPNTQTPLRLMRVARGQHTVIGYLDGALNFEDNALHIIEWRRDRSGRMTVTIDGTPRINVTDARLRDPFTLVALGNQGGDYGVRNISLTEVR